MVLIVYVTIGPRRIVCRQSLFYFSSCELVECRLHYDCQLQRRRLPSTCRWIRGEWLRLRLVSAVAYYPWCITDTLYHSLSALDGSMPQFVYTVVDTAPRFVSCMQAAGAHCSKHGMGIEIFILKLCVCTGAGMTFALNPTAEMTYDQFLANAIAS